MAIAIALLLGAQLRRPLPPQPFGLLGVFVIEALEIGVEVLLLRVEQRQVILVGLAPLAGVPLGEPGPFLGILLGGIVIQEDAGARRVREQQTQPATVVQGHALAKPAHGQPASQSDEDADAAGESDRLDPHGKKGETDRSTQAQTQEEEQDDRGRAAESWRT